MKKILQVVCAIIENDGKILIAQRSESMALPLKWEFPGGKIEHGENKQEALKREIQEELALDISVGEALTPITYHYPDFSICLYPFRCTTPERSFTAKEHKTILWEKPENLHNYDWAAADVPVVGEVIKCCEKIKSHEEL